MVPELDSLYFTAKDAEHPRDPVPLTYEIVQPGSFLRDDFRDLTVFVGYPIDGGCKYWIDLNRKIGAEHIEPITRSLSKSGRAQELESLGDFED